MAGSIIIGVVAVLTDETVDIVPFIDGDPFQLHLSMMSEVVDEEFLDLDETGTVHICLTELDDVQRNELRQSRNALQESMLRHGQ